MTVMDAHYWDRVGDDYPSAIFDSAGNDRSGFHCDARTGAARHRSAGHTVRG